MTVDALPGLRYIVQKHAASRLHYDFRLEIDGVLKSWAVPKGPSSDPQQRSLAVQVEDHPLSYGEFEGVIPAGEYGGGTVMLWDRGTWFPEGDPSAQLQRGKLRFRLDGEKLHGGWSLMRMSGRAGDGGKNWLLIMRQDENAHPRGEGEPLNEMTASVRSGRSMDQIAANADAVWDGGAEPLRGRATAPQVNPEPPNGSVAASPRTAAELWPFASPFVSRSAGRQGTSPADT